MASFQLFTNPRCCICLSNENKAFLKYNKNDNVTADRYVCEDCVNNISTLKDSLSKHDLSSGYCYGCDDFVDDD